LATTPSIKGLRVVGGHSSGDALICFDKPAFTSYGLKQAANAPVSEMAMGAVKAALDELISDAPILCGMKFVHWYDRDIEKTDDPFFDDNLLGLGFGGDEEAEEENLEETELQARKKADRVIHAVQSGDTAPTLDAIYHILLLSGVGGRVMVRRYEMGEYKTLRKNLDRWNRDLALVNPYGMGLCKPLKLTGRLIRLLKYQKNDRKIFERLDKELSGITPAVLTAILGGGRLPDAVAIRALAYIRSKLLANDEEQKDDNLDGWACQWLKVWLLRNHERSEEHLNEYYNPNHPEPAYHCGAVMAVYGEIQHKAMPEVNVNMAQRFYASCIQTPALVLGRLSQMSVHHLAKIENKFYQNLYRELLEQVHSAIGPVIPTTLNLEKQSYFALGYYQMYAKMRQDRMDAVNKNKEEA
jgi:CRISPR-associated protein Csd1